MVVVQGRQPNAGGKATVMSKLQIGKTGEKVLISDNYQANLTPGC